MTIIDVRASVVIDREPAVVRRQFADVAHHERNGVHRGVQFEVIEDKAGRCHYRQITRLGPLRLPQEILLKTSDEGLVVNTVLAGQFAGGTITFDIRPAPGSHARSCVEARLVAELTGLEALFRPVLRRSVTRALSRALEEDKNDLEHGGYALLTADRSRGRTKRQ